MLKYFVFRGRRPFETLKSLDRRKLHLQSLVWQSLAVDHTEEVDSGSV